MTQIRFTGMALLSMCINLMQEQLVLKTRWCLTELGLYEEDIDPMKKYKVSIFLCALSCILI